MCIKTGAKLALPDPNSVVEDGDGARGAEFKTMNPEAVHIGEIGVAVIGGVVSTIVTTIVTTIVII